MLERFFQLRQHGTTIGTEIAAGLVTFLTAAYVLAVNPGIHAAAGMPADEVFTATVLGIVIGSLFMGLFANMPFLMAPGMGINGFFAYVVVQNEGYSWQEALTIVFLAGLLFVLAVALGLRDFLVRIFPESLRYALGVSLGLIIADIGLANIGMVVQHGMLHKLGEGPGLLVVLGLLATGAFLLRGLKNALLLGIAATLLLAVLFGQTDFGRALEGGIFSLPPAPASIALAFDFNWEHILTLDFLVLVLIFFFYDVFDSLGTYLGIAAAINGPTGPYLTRIPKALVCDAFATVAGSCLGVSTVTTYIESSAGVASGGRTGLTAVTVAFLALLALFFSPLFLAMPAVATVPALAVVGMFLMGTVKKINFTDISEGLPAFICIIVSSLTWSISDGLMFGWIGFVVLKFFAGRRSSLTPATVIVGFVFMLKLLLL